MYEVSVFPVKKDDAGGWRAELTEKITFRQETRDPIAAKAMALLQRRKGHCVILRPKFNEPHLGGLGFREWRSFDGELFREVHWPEYGPLPSSSQVRLDDEIVVPAVPKR